MTFAIIEYDDAMDEHIVPPVQKWSEWRLRLARWLLRADQDAARERLRSAIARSGQPNPVIQAVMVRSDGERFTLDQPIPDGSYTLEFEEVEDA